MKLSCLSGERTESAETTVRANREFSIRIHTARLLATTKKRRLAQPRSTLYQHATDRDSSEARVAMRFRPTTRIVRHRRRSAAAAATGGESRNVDRISHAISSQRGKPKTKSSQHHLQVRTGTTQANTEFATIGFTSKITSAQPNQFSRPSDRKRSKGKGEMYL